MQYISPGEFLFIYFIAAVIGLLILYAIIGSATMSHKKVQLAKVQVNLLISIAEKLGVEKDKIMEDIKPVMRTRP